MQSFRCHFGIASLFTWSWKCTHSALTMSNCKPLAVKISMEFALASKHKRQICFAMLAVISMETHSASFLRIDALFINCLWFSFEPSNNLNWRLTTWRIVRSQRQIEVDALKCVAHFGVAMRNFHWSQRTGRMRIRIAYSELPWNHIVAFRRLIPLWCVFFPFFCRTIGSPFFWMECFVMSAYAWIEFERFRTISTFVQIITGVRNHVLLQTGENAPNFVNILFLRIIFRKLKCANLQSWSGFIVFAAYGTCVPLIVENDW